MIHSKYIGPKKRRGGGGGWGGRGKLVSEIHV